MAEKFADRATAEVLTNQSTAFSVALVAVHVCKAFPKLADLLRGELHSRSYMTIPYYKRRADGQSDSDYLVEIGYLKSYDGTMESEDKYQERMTGFMVLYAAIMQTRTEGNPFTIDEAWAWLSVLLNQKSRRISPYVLLGFLEVAGFELECRFGRQFAMAMHVMHDAFVPTIPKGCESAKARLVSFFVDWSRQGRLQEHKGRAIPE